MFLRPTAVVCGGARALSTMRAAAALPRDLFADRSVFITGGGSGINLGIAVAFAAEVGAHV